MRVFTIAATIIAIVLIIFNTTKLDFDALFRGESATAAMTIIAALCVIVLLQIFKISKKIEKLHKRR